jgi:hypothetical protein
MKKIIFITLGIVLIGVAVLGWFVFYQSPDSTISENVRDILPFGQGGGDLSAPADNDKPEEIIPVVNEGGRNIPALFRLSEVPVSGAIGFLKNNSTFIRYTDRATGHIYDINPTTLEKIKIANNTLPKIYQATFKKGATGVIYKSLKEDSDEVITTSIELIPPKGTSTVALYTEVSTIIRGSTDNIDVGDSGKLAYYSADENAIVVSSFNGATAQSIYQSLFRDWNIKWAGNTVTLVTKPSAYVDGVAYALNPTSGGLKKLKGPLKGLTLLRNTLENRIIYSYNDGSLTRAYYEDPANNESGEIEATFADKCVWGNKQPNIFYCATPEGGIENNEPDLWYQGRTHYQDSLIKYNTLTGEKDLLVSAKKDFNVDIDVMNSFLTPDEDYLIFTNRNDLSLWALKLVE